jgi:hypothetical protein
MDYKKYFMPATNTDIKFLEDNEITISYKLFDISYGETKPRAKIIDYVKNKEVKSEKIKCNEICRW